MREPAPVEEPHPVSLDPEPVPEPRPALSERLQREADANASMLVLVRAEEQRVDRQAERDHKRRNQVDYTGPMLGDMLREGETE